jgi:signal peptidase I
VATLGIGASLGTLAMKDRLGGLAVWSLVPVMLAEFLIACLCTCRLFRTTFGKAVLIWACSAGTLGTAVTVLAFAVLRIGTDAFVVPTGAMSPAIYGMHCYKVCRHCGNRFGVGVSYRLDPVPTDAVTTCTNCGRSTAILPSDATISGDRILANVFSHPGRWDAVVFRPPDQPDAMYVMRLVGMPGEEIEIREGDIFVDGQRQRKPPGQVTELWLPVHDTDFTPSGPPLDNEPRWRSHSDESHWQWGSGEGWQFSGGPGQRGELEFSRPVLDQFAYNADVQRWPSARAQEWQVVRDVKVKCAVSEFRGEGRMGFHWRFGKDKIVARVSAEGDVEIVGTTNENSEDVDENAERTRAQGQLQAALMESSLTFAFRDGMAYVTQDDCLIASLTLQDRDTIHQASEPEEDQRIAIFAVDCEVALRRIQLYRDVYYLSVDETGFRPISATPNPIQLDDQQYLMLGDNSRQSRDSRYFGPAATDSVKGVVNCICWPPERLRRFGSPLAGGGD